MASRWASLRFIVRLLMTVLAGIPVADAPIQHISAGVMRIGTEGPV